ncbi:phage upper tail fiber protein [Mesorhizobium australicum]|uniref:phage upper tail fiber protein n=1 Tax=Mesorhizobium australicum TaxID=536018 RepID=UPI003336202A
MTTVPINGREVISLPAYSAISITVSGQGSGTVERLGNNPGEASFGEVAVTANKMVGPFAFPTRHVVRCSLPTFSYAIAEADFPAVTSDVERIAKLTQSEYDALTPDPATLYLIVG